MSEDIIIFWNFQLVILAFHRLYANNHGIESMPIEAKKGCNLSYNDISFMHACMPLFIQQNLLSACYSLGMELDRPCGICKDEISLIPPFKQV